jgi:hypothetical protein
MWKEKIVPPEDNRISVPLKAAALVALMAIIALVVVSVDAPRLITAPDAPLAKVADIFLTADGPPPGASREAVKAMATTVPPDLHAAAPASEYFPSRFAAPQGAPEAAPPTF